MGDYECEKKKGILHAGELTELRIKPIYDYDVTTTDDIKLCISAGLI